MKKLTVRVENLTSEGFGYAKHNENDVFVIGAIPGEMVETFIIKKRAGRRWAIVNTVVEASPDRIGTPVGVEEFENVNDGNSSVGVSFEDHYLSCSPWQVFSYQKQIELKRQMLVQAYAEHGITIKVDDFVAAPQTEGYRTKMECNFWYQDNYLYMAFHKRGTPFVLTPLPEGCKLASVATNAVAKRIVELINKYKIPKTDLKSLTIRESKTQNQRVAILCVKRDDFALPFQLSDIPDLHGLVTVFSDPLSPASQFTKILRTEGLDFLEETIAGLTFRYPLDGFFQNNIPLFEKALEKMRDVVNSQAPVRNIVELYSGVGTIGLALCQQADKVTGIESVPSSIEYARANARRNSISNYECQAITAEKMDSNLLADTDILVLDPPRTGLHQDVVNSILQAKPKTILYLSCNPVTQARDCALLKQHYSPASLTGYDFYPNTMHMESLLVLTRRQTVTL